MRLLAALVPRFRLPLIRPPENNCTVLAKLPRLTFPLMVPAFEIFVEAPELRIAGPLVPVMTPPALFVTEPPPARSIPSAAPEIVPELDIVAGPFKPLIPSCPIPEIVAPASLVIVAPPDVVTAAAGPPLTAATWIKPALSRPPP